MSAARRYVAIGDSFTEGVGDHHRSLPNSLRGWADRVAEQLAKHESGWEYANLAVRSKRLRHIIQDQLQPALEMKPTLITVYAGGNDLLDLGTNVDTLLVQYEDMVAQLAETGARLLLFTGYEVPLPGPLRAFKRRNNQYNAGVRRIAKKYGATLVDFWAFEGLRDRRMWSADRMHLSKSGHKYVAIRVLKVLGVPHSIKLKQRGPLPRRTGLEWERAQRRWAHDWVYPLIGRKIRRVTLGDDVQPRWPNPVVVPAHGGLRSFAHGTPPASGAKDT
ncbi:MAG TPA: SGNH/GDSL hydrolase family protein [Glaciihabitans sp.]|jgi:lysophospholipase L1-like esterase|nr:SGNH/GDSL hydrolase family protein [Glaciihabitans sp.]